MTAPVAVTTSVSVTVSSGVAISAKSTSTTAGDHVGVFNLAADGGANNRRPERGVGEQRVQRVRGVGPRIRPWHSEGLARQSGPRPRV